ncbi:hypothetical protein FA13DRAFT_1733023, partial [Coprinellus micaceus]
MRSGSMKTLTLKWRMCAESRRSGWMTPVQFRGESQEEHVAGREGACSSPTRAGREKTSHSRPQAQTCCVKRR